MSVSVKRSAATLAAILCAIALVPATASAQSYGNQGYDQSQGYGNSGYQDRCQTVTQGRTGAGALIGAGLGAVAGSQVARRGSRTEGSIIGGILGAVVGAQVGRSSNSNCQFSDYRGSADASSLSRYDTRGYDDRAQSYGRYDDRGRYASRRDERRYENGYEISPDGRSYYDPRRGWLPR
jgi:hypothetical protein